MRFRVFGQQFFVNRLWLVITLAAFLILSKLSYWQWQRAVEKESQLQILAAQQQGPLTAGKLLSQAPHDIDGALLSAEGEWISPYIWLLDNQILAGRVGYDVIVPMRFHQTNAAVLVNLGWVSAPASREHLPSLYIPPFVVVDGLVRSKLGGMLLGQNLEGDHYPMRMQQVDFIELQQRLDLPLYPAIVYQQQMSAFTPHYQPVVMLPEKHRGYAMQWLGLAIAVVAVAIAAARQPDTKTILESPHE